MGKPVLAAPLPCNIHHHTRKSTSTSIRRNYPLSRKSTLSSLSSSSSSSSSKSYKKQLNAINSWNVRSLSSLHLNTMTDEEDYDEDDDNDNVLLIRRRRQPSPSSSPSSSSSSLSKDDFSKINNDVTLTSRRKNVREEEYPLNDEDYQLAIQEMKAKLGPVGLLIANSVEVGIAAAGSYVSGGMLGYFYGGVMGIPKLFRKGVETSSFEPINLNNNALKDFQKRMGNWNSKAFTQGKNWAALSASFSGFHALTRVCRGGKEDHWNSIFSSAFAGAYLNRNAGPQAMFQAAYTYAGFTYMINKVFGPPSSTGLNKEFDFTDTPIEERGY